MTRELAQIIDKETGDVNELRDKKLADATSQSVINTNDAIEMKTTTGEQVFITKDSFMQAIGQAFSASDPKTFTKLLGMNNGSPMGIGASDLASVLGGLNTVCSVKQLTYPTYVSNCLMATKDITIGVTNYGTENCPGGNSSPGCIVIIPIWWGSALKPSFHVRFWWAYNASSFWIYYNGSGGTSGWKQIV